MQQAIKLPIWIYSKTKFLDLSGEIVLDTNEVYAGMITIGRTNNYIAASGGGTEILNSSKIIFKGKSHIGGGCRILIYGKGELTIGNNVVISNQCIIGCCNSISIGDSLSMAHQVQIFDTDFHFMYNLANKTVKMHSKSVVLGKSCWLGNRVTVMKGTEIPDYTIVSSNTLLNKKYDVPQGTILAGTPAKEMATGYIRIRNHKIESKLHNYFDLEGKSVYQFPEDTKWEGLVKI